MAKKAKIFSQIFLGVASALTLSFASQISPAHACTGDETGQTNCTEETALVSQSQAEDIYAEADAEVKSEREVNHSYFLAGNQVISEDKVNGLSAFAGNIVEFKGESEYGALAGNIVKVTGSIKKDLFVAGKTIEISNDAKVGRDFYGIASSLTVEGALNGNAFISGQTIVLHGTTISGNLTIAAEKIVVEDGAKISGTFKYNDSAEVTGLDKLSYETVETYALDIKQGPTLSAIETTAIFFLAKLLATIIFVAICSKFSKRLIDEFELKNSWKDLALGLGLVIGTPIAIVFTMITVIGLPIGLIALGFYVLFVYFSTSAAGGVLGDTIAKKLFKKEKMHIILKYAIGLTLITLLGFIPYIGGLITSIASCFGFGYIVHKVFRANAKNKK